MTKNHKSRWEEQTAELMRFFPALKIMVDMFQRLDDINLCVKDVNGHYLSVNEAFLRSVPPLKHEEVIGKTSFDLYPHSLAVGFQEQDQKLLAKGEDLIDQLEMITNPDGSLGWYLTHKYLLKSTDGIVHAIVGMSRDLHKVYTDDPRYDKLALALKTIQTEYHRSIRISDLANQSGLSLSQFERLMRSLVQLTPRQYLTSQRVKAASDLLRSSTKSLASIATECGFSDQASFSKQFKAITSISPLKYRQMHRTDT